mgnify:CR=1 FL=1
MVMPVERICLLGFGEVGYTLAEDLLAKTSVELRLWDKQLNLKNLADNPRIQIAESADSAALDCQLVLSAVTANEAMAAAQSVMPGISTLAWFVDLNSVSPATKQQISDIVEQAGGRFVEASIMSPIAPAGTASPILLSGGEASYFEATAKAIGFSGVEVVSSSLGRASATKMCRSVIVKGMEALAIESLVAARHYGVEDAVLASLNNLFPRDDWPQFARYLISRSLQHGTRRAAEMREAAKTVTETGLDPLMSEACAKRQDWAAQYKTLLREQALNELLDSMGVSMDHSNQIHRIPKSNTL